MDITSVGATINVMMAAVLAEGRTIIENAAKEPHVVDVANFLNRMGASVRGAGTDVIRIKGVPKLHGTDYAIIAVHAGLECGLFAERYPNLDMLSMGPTMRGVHSPDERLHIPSVEKVWKLVLEILKEI